MKAPETLKQIISHAKDEGILTALGSTLTYTELCAQLKYHIERGMHFEETNQQTKALLEGVTCEEIRERIRDAGWTVPPNLSDWGNPHRDAGQPSTDAEERTIRASFKLDPALFRQLALYAEAAGKTRTAIVEEALRAYLGGSSSTKEEQEEISA